LGRPEAGWIPIRLFQGAKVVGKSIVPRFEISADRADTVLAVLPILSPSRLKKPLIFTVLDTFIPKSRNFVVFVVLKNPLDAEYLKRFSLF
jgi:hypothetical protein